MNGKYKRRGWFGDSKGHSLAAKGVRLYSRKKELDNALFFAKQEQSIPTPDIHQMAIRGMTLDEMQRKYPDSDKEDLRRRGIRAVEGIDANNMLSLVESSSERMLLDMSAKDERFKKDVIKVLSDDQKSSFIHPAKVELLKAQLK